MAYELSDRFKQPTERFRLLEPGAYQYSNSPKVEPNKVPFLSNTPRKTVNINPVWTHVLYYADLPPKIPNCTSISSKIPRFPYEAFSEKDLEEILCKCGIENQCKCPVEDDEEIEKKEQVVCQRWVPRRLFKGIVPRSSLGDGLSAPSKRDNGFKLLPDGTKIRIFTKPKNDSPPFYNTNVNESTAFYQGCKWSKWTARRDSKFDTDAPGPSDYFIEKEPDINAICAEKVRALKRKTSKQYRFIEMVQRRNIIEGRPGPADYSPVSPKGTDLKILGPKAERFLISKYQDQPGPTAYLIKRDFDLVEIPAKPCQAKLPPPAGFGVRAVRLKPRKEEGPSPASYNARYKPCQVHRCKLVPFGSSSERFKNEVIEEDDYEDLIMNEIMKELNKTQDDSKIKNNPTWEFKSKTIRMKPLKKLLNEPSPADLPLTTPKSNRLLNLQKNCPFFSSERRLKPWFNWIPVHGKENTPGPAYYCLEKPQCLPAVCQGPINRSPRFPRAKFQTPAPNEYVVNGGIEDVLVTYNHRLNQNIQNKHSFKWNPPVEKSMPNLADKENILLQKSIQLLEFTDIFAEEQYDKKNSNQEDEEIKKSKLLRCFLFSKKMPNY